MEFSFVGLDFFSLIIIMFTISFLGWLYESTLYSLIEQRKFMNRGYLLGPYCPIYSVVCMSAVYFLKDIESLAKVYILGTLIVTAIEYITSYTMEKLFNARYWDYSEYPLNLNGRVSVISSMFFGFTTMFVVKVLDPFLRTLVGIMPDRGRIFTALFLLTIFIVDLIVTTMSMCNLNKKCEEIYQYIDNKLDAKFEEMTDKSRFLDDNVVFERKLKVKVKFEDMSKAFKENEMHFFRAFPNFKSTRYEELMDKIKNMKEFRK